MKLGELPGAHADRLRSSMPDCLFVAKYIKSIGEYLELLQSLLNKGERFWFRGHGDCRWRLAPSALRFHNVKDRERAIKLLAEFKRLAPLRLSQPPRNDQDLLWLQLAQHYGLPTRLLDWTQNALIALYFACLQVSQDGVVFMLNPVDLNRSAGKDSRILDANLDRDAIQQYMNLGARVDPGGLPTIAINPTWDSDRISLQKGVFSLHGTKKLALTSKQVPSLVGVPILRGQKRVISQQLESVGVDEMSIFPEPEHICSYLKASAGLC